MSSMDKTDSPVGGSAAGAVRILVSPPRSTTPARPALAEAAHTAIIKPMPLRAAVAGWFTLDDVTIDETTGHAVRSNGLTRRCA